MSAVELVSPLPPDQCEDRLRAATDPDGVRSWFGSRPAVGRVSGGSVRLRKRLRYNNPFQTVLTGSLEGHGEGTIFRGRAGVYPLVTAFVAVWFGGVVVAGSFLVVAAVRGQPAGGPPGLTAVISALVMGSGAGLVLGLGAGVVRFGRWLARGEEAFLVAFVAEAVAASRGPDAEPGAAADSGA